MVAALYQGNDCAMASKRDLPPSNLFMTACMLTQCPWMLNLEWKSERTSSLGYDRLLDQ